MVCLWVGYTVFRGPQPAFAEMAQVWMMMAISVENVSKKFVLRQDHRGRLGAVRSLLGRGGREDFWALRDVDLRVRQGEAVGIIGHNGAGKSTLLKLLTRIMQPTTGRIRARGRISALIEVGAGFHPEMTGRENIYLNGTILGMKRGEIKRKFDDMVSFAELERFIDTPVKRYSSGMYARLGFAVAAHVDPEVLVVDEVLSVGDLAFQARCSDRMTEMRRSGVTVVVVSHNMNTVASLCDRVTILDGGQATFTGDPEAAVRKFRDDCARRASVHGGEAEVYAAEELRIIDVRSVSSEGQAWQARTGEPWSVSVTYESSDPDLTPEIGFKLLDENGLALAWPSTLDYGFDPGPCVGVRRLSFRADALPLQPGKYGVEVFAWDNTGYRPLDEGNQRHALTVLPGRGSGAGAGTRHGKIVLPGMWSEESQCDGGRESVCRG